MASMSRKRITAILLIFVMLVAEITVLEPSVVSAATSVKIGQATSDESGNIRGGKAGDQTGKELGFSKWSYSSKSGAYNNWKYVIRAKDPDLAKELAASMKKACNNNHIGYDQQSPDRFSCFDEAKAVGWDLSKIEKDCETTCSSIISVCLNASGISIDRYWDASLIYKDLKATGLFNFFTSSEFTASSNLLEPGDILLSPGRHSAMVVESPNAPGSTVKTAAAVTSPFVAGKDYQLVDYLHVRTGASTVYSCKTVSQLTENAKLYATTENGKAVLNKGTVVTCLRTKGNWIQIPSGWICGMSGSTPYIVEYKDTAAQRALYESALNANRQKAAAEEIANTTTSTTTAITDTATNATTAATTATTTTTAAKATASTANAVVIKAGRNYVLLKVLNVRTGPGTNYKNVKRKNLTKDGKKHATKSSAARLKKGTVVTCLQVKGNWMRIPSGWICCKPGNVAASK